MFETLKSYLDSGALNVVEQFELPARPAVFAPIPPLLFTSSVGDLLRTLTGAEGLWQHQSEALDALCALKNVVVSTGTASGKSLIFRACAFHRLLRYPDAKVLVFYPLKALVGDQMRGWQAMAAALGLPANTIGRIDGSVPVGERENILATARVIVMTPDVAHAWLMSRLSLPSVKMFLARLAIVVLDEAHTLEGVFGSSFAFLMRRVMCARHFLQKQMGIAQELQLVAATATILRAEAHLEALTGMPFVSITEASDGSPQHARICAHVAAPPGQEMAVARAIHQQLLTHGTNGGFITFVDSRKGVEMLAKDNTTLDDLITSAQVLPYRAGYVTDDRERIEGRLRAGTLRGVVSTGALEMGIDLPHLTVGLNLNVPATRKGYRQRLGRIGRATPGIFAIVAPPDAFTGFGSTFREYHDASVEDSLLYTANRFMGFSHARCLVDELEALRAPVSPPAKGAWPEHFDELFAWAKPGGNRPPAFDAIAQIGGDTPHYNFPLRNVGESNYRIVIGESDHYLGDANLSQALREAYPGASYYHLGRAYEVQNWQINHFAAPQIRVRAGQPHRITRPRIRTWINTGISSADLMEGHCIRSDRGFLAEAIMQVTERVEGFDDSVGSVYKSYSELRQTNPNMKPRIRNFRTSGVVLSIAEPWFAKAGVKGMFVERLMAVFAREFSVLPHDIGCASTNIAIRTADGNGPTANAIAIFDQTCGSLRLTERLYLQFDALLERLERASEIEEDEGALLSHVRSIRTIVSGFNAAIEFTTMTGPDAIGSHHRVFTPGSRVCYREMASVGCEVEIVRPTVMQGKLMYQILCPPKFPSKPPIKQWVNAEFIEPTAGDGEWDQAWWNTETEEYEDPPEETADVPEVTPT